MRKLVRLKNKKTYKWDLIQIETSYYKDKRGREFHTSSQVNIASGYRFESLPTYNRRTRDSSLISKPNRGTPKYHDSSSNDSDDDDDSSSRTNSNAGEVYVEVSSDEDFFERLRLGRKRQFKDISCPSPPTTLFDPFFEFDSPLGYGSTSSISPGSVPGTDFDVPSTTEFKYSQSLNSKSYTYGAKSAPATSSIDPFSNLQAFPSSIVNSHISQTNSPQQSQCGSYPYQADAQSERSRYGYTGPPWPFDRLQNFNEARSDPRSDYGPYSAIYLQGIPPTPPWWNQQQVSLAQQMLVPYDRSTGGQALNEPDYDNCSSNSHMLQDPVLSHQVTDGDYSSEGTLIVPDQGLQGCLAEVSMFNMTETSYQAGFFPSSANTNLFANVVMPKRCIDHQSLEKSYLDTECLDSSSIGRFYRRSSGALDHESGSSSTACCSSCDLTLADQSISIQAQPDTDQAIEIQSEPEDENEPIIFNRLIRVAISARGGSDLSNPWTWSTMYQSQALASRELADPVVLPSDVRKMFAKLRHGDIWCLFRRVPMSVSQVRALLLFYCRSRIFYCVMRWATSRCIKRTIVSRSRRDQREVYKQKFLHPCVECSGIVLVRTDEATGLVYGRCLTCDRLHSTFRFDGSCVDEPTLLCADDHYEPTELDRQALNFWTEGGSGALSFLFSLLAIVGPGLTAMVDRRKNEFVCIDCGLGIIAAVRVQAYAMCTWCKSTIRSTAVIDNADRGIDQHVQYALDALTKIKAEYARTSISLDDIE